MYQPFLCNRLWQTGLLPEAEYAASTGGPNEIRGGFVLSEPLHTYEFYARQGIWLGGVERFHSHTPSAVSLGGEPYLVKVISQVSVPCDHLYQQTGFPPVAAVDELCPVLVSAWT